MSDKNELNPPDTSRAEAILAVVKAAVEGAGAAVPVPLLGPIVGGSLAEAIGFFGQREIDKRLSKFLDAVVQGLEDMRADVANLKESFWSTFFDALDAARRTHQQEKLEALKNAVLNAAKPTAPDDDLQHMFVKMVTDLTPLHLRLLGFLLYPRKWGVDVEDYRGLHTRSPKLYGVWDVIQEHVAGTERRDLVELCFRDMVACGLLRYSTDPPPMQGLLLPGPTDFAWDFYGFITSQDDQQDTGADSPSRE